jgi:pyruvate carboxylase
VLIPALKEAVDLPIHFHTHDTAGSPAARSSPPRRRASMPSIARWTRCRAIPAQATLGTVVEALSHTERDTGLDIKAIREISDYWEAVRAHYAAFESGLQAPASEVYLHEMPGGQFTNLKAQARSWGWRTAGTRSRRCMPM